MTYKRPDVHILRTARVCSDQRISKRLDELVGLDWRAAHSVVDVLETHFAVSREELERDTSDCLAELELAGLVQEKVVIER